ncbi:hypothetical protein ISCGN_002537 [Ixodes scapularis]
MHAKGGTDPSNKENVRTEVPWSSPVWAPKSGDALANLKGTSLQSESSPRCLREVQSSVERDKDPSTGALRETHTTLEKESQKGPGSVSQLKLPTDTVVPEGQASTIKKTTESRMESQQTKRVAQCGDHSIAESSHAVQKLMSDSRSMVSQSSFESNEAQRITKTTAQQQMKYSKQTFSSSSSFESSFP